MRSENPQSVLVTGATGSVGSDLIQNLLAKPGLRLRALVRDPAKARALADRGVELATGSFEDPASLVAAMTGIDTLALITAAGAPAADQAASAITAAKQAGVRKIVRLSAIKASADGPTDNTRQHGRTEKLPAPAASRNTRTLLRSASARGGIFAFLA